MAGFLVLAAPISAAQGATFTEFPVPTPQSQPAGITTGPDGALWFTEENGHKIGRITTGGAVTEFPIPTNPSGPPEITTGPDGALWFTEFAANPPKIGRLTTAGVFTEYALPIGSGPDGITTGPDGALWFTENGTNKIGRITTGGAITEYPLPAGFRPGDITAGPDGRLWFTESEANRIGAITTSGSITEYALPAGADPAGITATGGSLWFAMFGLNKIGRITTSGTVTEFGPTGTGPDGITLGIDGALWFTESLANKIGRMTPAGVLTNEFPIPTPGSEPGGIVSGPDGALWFTEFAGNKIGRISSAPASFAGYARPKGASPLLVSLVPAYDTCTAPNREHGPPLAFASCNPPVQASPNVTIGSPDANGAGANFFGAVRYEVIAGAPGAPDDSDVSISASLFDARCNGTAGVAPCGTANAVGGPDYAGELEARVSVRMIDRFNGTAAGGGTDAATVADTEIAAPFTCVSTASTSIGGACHLSTSANALVPGLVKDTKRAIWQFERVRVIDGGPDGDVDSAGNSLFATQGVYVR